MLRAYGIEGSDPAYWLSSLALTLDVPVTTVRNWVKREAVPAIYLTQAAKDTGHRLEWIRTGQGDPTRELHEYDLGAASAALAQGRQSAGDPAAPERRSQRMKVPATAAETPAPWSLPARVASTHSRGSATQGQPLSALLQPRGTGAVLPLVLSVPLGERGGATRDFEVIPKHTRAASAGAGVSGEADLIDRVGNLAFSFEWLRHNMRHTSGRLAEVQVQGDSMATTLLDGDTIIIDEGVTTVDVDGIYVLDVFGRRLVKRVQHLFDGTLVLISDNPNYQRETIPRDRARDVVVIGRMVWPRVR